MDEYSRYLILSHIYWSENNITVEKLNQVASEIRGGDIFMPVEAQNINLKLGNKILYREEIPLENYQKIKFLNFTFFNKIVDLSFVKYCSNLEAIEVNCYKLESLEALKENKLLKKISASNNRIENIEALFYHQSLEHLILENNPPLSLKPIANLKRIKTLNIGLIDNESYVLNFVKLNSNCKVKYLINGGPTDLENFIFNYYQIIIEKKENLIKIDLEGVETATSFPIETKIPEYLQEDKLYYERFIKSLVKEITTRLEIILERKINLNLDETYSFGSSYHMNSSYKFN
jgi:hypothetical protein